MSLMLQSIVLSLSVFDNRRDRNERQEKGKVQKNWMQRTGGRGETAIEIKKRNFRTRVCLIQHLDFNNPRIPVSAKEKNGASE